MPPSETTVKRALTQIRKGSAPFDYFFDSLTSAEWVRPLAEKGVFDDVPPVDRSEEGWIRIPAWSASRYLARVAAEAPQEVLDVALAIQTDNERVHSDLTRAAQSMPGPLAARWAEVEIQWLAARDHLNVLLDRDLARLAVHLLENGEPEMAFQLAAEMLRLYQQPDDEAGGTAARRVRARVGAWEYHQLVEWLTPALVRWDAGRTLGLLGSLLSQALEADGGDPASGEDHSAIWRAEIARSDRDERQIKHALVTALGKTASQGLDEALLDADELVQVLGAHSWRVFKRVLRHALGETVALLPNDVLTPMLMDLDEFMAPNPSPEYRALLTARFRELAEEDQEEILRWIDGGPNLAEYAAAVERVTGRTLSTAELARHDAAWKVLRLGLVADDLPEAWKTRYAGWIDEVGVQEFAPSSQVAVWTGPRSPYSPDELRVMGDAELVDLLATWQPPPGFGVASDEGLARSLGELAEQDPGRVSALAKELSGLRPVYLSGVIGGLTSAVREGSSVEWSCLLDLGDRIVASHTAAATEGDASELGEVEDETRAAGQAMLSMLSAGLTTGPAEIPISERSRVWGLIASLAEDADPTPDHEARFGGDNMDPSTLSLNTTRGQALHAALRYGLWVRRHAEDSEPVPTLDGTSRMPELFDLLDKHLDPGRDPSLAVRAVYGQWFPWMLLLDSAWAKARVDRIFERTNDSRWAAAWGAYVTLNAPYNDVFSAIEATYRHAVTALGTPGHQFRWLGSEPNTRLAQHLMILYLRGRLDLAPGGLLADFFARSEDGLRGTAIGFVGITLSEERADDPALLQRATALWATRLDLARQAPAQSTAELGALGWWFRASSLRGEWLLEQAEVVLKLGLSLEPDSAVFERLPHLTEASPETAARVLRLLLEREKDGWAIDGHRDYIRQTLAAILQSGPTRARDQAIDTVHWLGALGHREFRDLIKATGAPEVTADPG